MMHKMMPILFGEIKNEKTDNDSVIVGFTCTSQRTRFDVIRKL
ncbi:unknown [[Mannheimia] succiniciproducens MBEL55E]|uniref:Uncharacterized protein n=1 Tax=Mannheimia succiniciproducens (strain KCTC 0769BP / MBEL55E) TaxID=221988 RepID=Q65U13_MANSM|nr:unknown [[Mannheimia] succiniciproducens MBEL55E]